MPLARRNFTGGVSTTRQPLEVISTACQCGIAQIEVDGAVVLSKARRDGVLRAIIERFPLQHPKRILHGLGAGGFVLFLVEEPRQPAPKALDLERPGFSDAPRPRSWRRLRPQAMEQLGAGIDRQGDQARGLGLALVLACCASIWRKTPSTATVAASAL